MAKRRRKSSRKDAKAQRKEVFKILAKLSEMLLLQCEERKERMSLIGTAQ